jgi:hypothetical protein
MQRTPSVAPRQPLLRTRGRYWPGTSVPRNAAILPVLGVNRKWPALARNDADDPKAVIRLVVTV